MWSSVLVHSSLSHATLLTDVAVEQRWARRVAACVCPACAPQHTCAFCVCLCVQELRCETAEGELCVRGEWPYWTDWPARPCPDGSLAQLLCWLRPGLQQLHQHLCTLGLISTNMAYEQNILIWKAIKHLFLHDQHNFKLHIEFQHQAQVNKK